MRFRITPRRPSAIGEIISISARVSGAMPKGIAPYILAVFMDRSPDGGISKKVVDARLRGHDGVGWLAAHILPLRPPLAPVPRLGYPVRHG